MSALSNRSNFVSVVEYLHDEELSDIRHEYLNGTIHAMAGGTLRHSVIAKHILIGLDKQLKGKRCHSFGSDAAVHISLERDNRYYYPYASVACSPFDPNARAVENPVVIFEVLSPSTARIDQTEKKDAYLACDSIHHYILVEPEHVEMTIYSRKADGWEMTVYNERTDALPLTAIEVALSLAEIYEG